MGQAKARGTDAERKSDPLGAKPNHAPLVSSQMKFYDPRKHGPYDVKQLVRKHYAKQQAEARSTP